MITMAPYYGQTMTSLVGKPGQNKLALIFPLKICVLTQAESALFRDFQVMYSAESTLVTADDFDSEIRAEILRRQPG